MISKFKIAGIILVVLLVITGFFYFRYFFTYQQKNIMQRKIETITGQNLTVTVFGFDGKIIKRWSNIKKITSGQEGNMLSYTFFYTKDNRYVQIPNSVWYIAEEE